MSRPLGFPRDSSSAVCIAADRDVDERPVPAPTTPFGQAFFKTLEAMWEQTAIPGAWRSACVVSIPKKGDMSDMDHYRGISLISVPLKVLCALLAYRLADGLEEHQRLSQSQAGFRSREEAVAQAGCLYEILLRRRQAGKPTHVAFLDLQKAFDTVPHSALLVKLYSYGVRGRFLAFLQALYSHSEISVRWGTEERFGLERGVRQGCPLSPVLFNVFIDDIFRSCADTGVTVPGLPPTQLVPGLLFADDAAALAESDQALQTALDGVSTWASTWGMSFGISKCGILRVLPSGPPAAAPALRLTLQGSPVPVVQEYLYLGTLLTSDLDLRVMASHRATKARNVLAGMARFLRSHRIPLRTRLLVIKAVLVPTALYGAELWGMQQARVAPHQAVVDSALRMLIGSGTHFRGICRSSLQRELSLPPLHVLASTRRLRLLQKLPELVTWGGVLRTQRAPSAKGSWLAGTQTWLKSFLTRHRSVFPESTASWADIGPKALRQAAWLVSDTNDHTKALKTYGEADYGSSSRVLLTTTIWIRYPLGARALLRLRTGSFLTARRLAAMRALAPEYLTVCPFCRCTNGGETVSHMLVDCTAWQPQRDLFLAATIRSIVAHMDNADTGSEKIGFVLLGGRPAGFGPDAGHAPTWASHDSLRFRSGLTSVGAAASVPDHGIEEPATSPRGCEGGGPGLPVQRLPPFILGSFYFLDRIIPKRAAILQTLGLLTEPRQGQSRNNRQDAPCTGAGHISSSAASSSRNSGT
jgi:hypothetical protein